MVFLSEMILKMSPLATPKFSIVNFQLSIGSHRLLDKRKMVHFRKEESTVTIRFATREDIPGMIKLLKQVGGVHHDIRPDLFRGDAQKYDAPALEALLEDKNRPILIAGDTQVMGYAFCILRNVENDSVLCDRRELYLDDLCVEKACRGQGIATALYQEVLALARKLHCQTVTLNVWCGNDSAMAFYEKMGMKPQKIGMEVSVC